MTSVSQTSNGDRLNESRAPRPGTSAKPSLVMEEEALLAKVRARILGTGPGWQRANYQAELESLRETLAEERLPEDMASIAEQMERLKILARQSARDRVARADADNPYFGHMRLADDRGETRDICVGRSTFIDGDVRIVDWRNAPISRVFYQCRVGDTYELPIGRDHLLEGDVVARRTLTISGGQLRRVSTDEHSYVHDPERGWRANERPQLLGGAGAALRPDAGSLRGIRRDKHLPEIASLLDPQQFDLITRPDSGIIAIQGSAGSGKTTVALHRVAYLAFQNPSRFTAKNTLVLVYSRALANYISAVLPALGVEGVVGRTYDDWFGEHRRRLFAGLPRRHSETTPGVVSRFKQHALMLPLLAQAAEDYEGMEPADILDEVLTDRRWLHRQVGRFAPEAFTAREIDAVHQWCASQHAIRLEGGGANIDDKPSLDPEDDALLLRLHQLAVGPITNRRRRPLRYAHLVIDEVQDLSPVDLTVLLDTVPDKAPVTLAGDTAQQLSGSNDFQDWSYVLDSLGYPHLTISPLQISYRSTEPIMRLARDVLGPYAPDEPISAPRQGPAPRFFPFHERGAMMTFVADALQDLMDAEPDANVAVLTATDAQASAAYDALKRADLPRLRLVADQDFSFTPGIEVTDITQSKGLEFDYVMILDADAASFPDTRPARHLLHVGVTRAAHLCWLFACQTPSPLLPSL